MIDEGTALLGPVRIGGRFGIRAASTKKYRIERSEAVYDDKGVPRADFFT